MNKSCFFLFLINYLFATYFSIYYNHQDTKLLLDLLALNFGVAPCLKFLCIFDKNLQNTAKVLQLTANWQKTGSEGKFDLVVEFKNSKAGMEIFSKIPGASCTYVVEITPPVEEVPTKVVTGIFQPQTFQTIASILEFSTPAFINELFNPRIFNHKLFNPFNPLELKSSWL